MNKISISTVALSTIFAFTAISGVAKAMTPATTDTMMKKDDTMMSSTTDSMMKKEDSMMKKSSEIMKVENSMMKKDAGAMMSPTMDLFMGSRGEEVVLLQTFLVSKNILTMPAGVVMGYFGPVTKAALMSYQISVNVPSTGYFGPLTRAAMNTTMMMKVDDSMMKKDTMMPSATGTMMKKDDTMMSSTTDSMMKKEDSMMKKSI